MTVEPPPADAGRHLALRRFVELLRHAANGTDPAAVPARRPRAAHGEHDAAVGRYVHLDLDGLDHRIYYEAAGQGIGLLCQHTAGADGRQWRHLLEDAPRHRPLPGRRLRPPVPRQVAAARRPGLVGRALRAHPAAGHGAAVTLADVLGLDRPVFIGSSVGGMLALDLARHHADDFRAVIALEGGLHADIPVDLSDVEAASFTDGRPGQPRRHDDDDHVAHGARGEPPGDPPALRAGRARRVRRRHPLLRHRARPPRRRPTRSTPPAAPSTSSRASTTSRPCRGPRRRPRQIAGLDVRA